MRKSNSRDAVSSTAHDLFRLFRCALFAACAVWQAASADIRTATEEIKAEERRSVHYTKWSEYDFSAKARLNSDYHHYIQFNLDFLRSKPGIVIEHAELVLKSGDTHIEKEAGAEWGNSVEVHPVLRFQLSGAVPALDRQVAAIGSVQENRDTVFDVSKLVSSWFKSKNPSQCGAVALECKAERGYCFPQSVRKGNIIGDLGGVVLKVRYRAENISSVSGLQQKNKNNLLRKGKIASTFLAPGSSPAESLLDGKSEKGFAFADNESSSRIAISGFSSPVRQIDLWDTGKDSRSPRLVKVRSSLKAQNSLDSADYETELGSFIPVFRPVATADKKFAYLSSLAVKAPEGTRSLLLDFGPSAAFVNGAEGVGTRLAEIQAFAEPGTKYLRQPRKMIDLPDKTGRVRYNIASLNKKSPYGKKLTAEYPDLNIIGSCLYDHHEFYSPKQRDTYHRSSPGFPFTRHKMIAEKDIADSLVMLSNGVPIDPASPEFQKNRYHADRAFSIQNPALLAAWEKLMPNCSARGYEGLIFADHHYPHPFKYLSGGYSRIETEAFRSYLSGGDDGFPIYALDGKTVVWKFWDYFKFYYGFVWTPADVGLKSWDEYSAYKGDWVHNNTNQNRLQLLHYVLLRYSMLKFDSSVGRIMQRNDLKYFPMYYDEAPWNSTDFLIALRTVGISVIGYEQFTQAPDSFQSFQDHTLEFPYSYWGKLYRENPYSKNRLCVVFEVSHNGVRRDPYWSPAFTFTHTLDIIMAGNLKSAAMDFFPGCDPKSDEWKLKDSIFRASLSAASVVSVPEMKFKHLPRRILVIGSREMDRRNCPFVPNGLAGRGRQILFGAFEMGSFPWILNRLGIEFDFSDATLSGVDLAQYPVVIYDARDLPDGLFRKLKEWVQGSSKRTLMTHGVLPTRRISSPDWDAAHPVLVRYGGQKLVDPCAGAMLGLQKISPGKAILQPIEAVTKNLSDVSHLLKGKKFLKDVPVYSAEGVQPLLISGDQPVLSECTFENGGRLLYFHYDFGRKSNAAFDMPLLSGLLNQCGETGIYAALPPKHMSVHIYIPEWEPDARVVVVRDREHMENEVIRNTHNRKMNYLLGPAPGLKSEVSLNRWCEGDMTVYSFNTGKSHTILSADKSIPLVLKDQMSDVFLVKPARSDSGLLMRFQKEREHLSPYMGEKTDRKLLDIYAKKKASTKEK